MMPHERPKTKSYVAGKDLFLFSVFCIVTKKTGNTGAGKLCGRAHPMADGVYLLYRLLEDDSTKSYGEEKTNRNSTDNRFFLSVAIQHGSSIMQTIRSSLRSLTLRGFSPPMCASSSQQLLPP